MVGDLRGGKVSQFAQRQEYMDRTKMDAELKNAVEQIKKRVVVKVQKRRHQQLFYKTETGHRAARLTHDESHHDSDDLEGEEDLSSILKSNKN
jgi:hypothetical protein